MKIKRKVNGFHKICRNAFIMLFLLGAAQLTAQTNNKVAVKTDSLKGVVIDQLTKKPLVGATVQTIDGKYSAMTNEQGNFQLTTPDYKRTLRVSAPGYDKIEMYVQDFRKPKEIGLYPAGIFTPYADKTTFWGTVRRAVTAQAVNSYDVDNSTSYTVDNVMSKAISGDVSLNMHSGTPSSGLAMYLRGINSLNANTQPLIVVDGVITETKSNETSIHLGNTLNPLSVIDVNDVQNISVLKDGTAIFGSKGSNGVILITTNRGKSAVTKINVSSVLGYNMKPTLPQMMNAADYRIYLSDLNKKGEIKSVTIVERGDSKSLLFNPLSDQYLVDDPNYFYYNKYHNNTDWSNEAYAGSTTQSYNVAVNGGDEVALYNLSVGFTNALSTLKKNSFTRLNARFNSDINLFDRLNAAFDISYTQVERDMRNDGLAESNYGQVNSPGFLSLIKAPFLSPYRYNNQKEKTQTYDYYDLIGVANPSGILDMGVGHSQQKNFNVSVLPKLALTKNLNLSSHFSYTIKNLSENMFSPSNYVAPYLDINNNNFFSENYVKTQFMNQSSLFSDTRLNWKKIIPGETYDVKIGARYLGETYKSEYAVGHNTGSNFVKEINKDLKYRIVDGFNYPYKLLSYYGTFNCGLKDKYFLELAMVMETSSRFGKSTKSGLNMLGVSWGVFPSANVAWLISSEKFMKNLKFVDMLKLRGGIGKSGNDDIDDTASKAYFRAVQYAYKATGIELRNIANPAIQWESVLTRNAGLDAVLFNRRLDVSFDVFNNTTNNLLVMKTPETFSGIGSYWTNDGRLQNVGFELNVNAVAVKTRDFSATVGVSVAHYDNKIHSLANGDYLTDVYGGQILTAVNQPVGLFYGYRTNNVFSTSEEAKAAGLSVRGASGLPIALEAGDVKFVDTYKDNIIDEKDKTVIGNSNPDFYGMINADLKYKRVGLTAVFGYSYGNDVYNYQRAQLESGSTVYNQTTAMKNRWMTEGQVTGMPKSVYGDPKGNNRFSDRWIEDGSYLRLKTVEVSYDIPVQRISFLQGIKVWLAANNMWTLTKYLGSDPEFAASNNFYYRGIDTGILPQSKSIYAGIRVNL